MRRGASTVRRESLFWSRPRVKVSFARSRCVGDRDVPDNVPFSSVTRGNPQTEDVLVFPDTQHDTIDLFADPIILFSSDPVSDQRVDNLFPHSICDTFSQSENPSSPSYVCSVFPGRCNRRTEDVVVANDVDGVRSRVGRVGIEDGSRGVEGRRKGGRRNEVSEERMKGFNLSMKYRRISLTQAATWTQ